MKVFISAGHGGTDPGAVYKNKKEKDLVLISALACRDFLKKNGVSVVMSRTKDENDPVEEEIKEACSSNADLAVSFHLNASVGGTARGFEIYYYPDDKRGLFIANKIAKNYKKIGIPNHGNPTKHGDWLAFINSTNCSAILIESFFLNNAVDIKKFGTNNFLKKIGENVGSAIIETYGIEQKKYVVTKIFKSKKNLDKFVTYCKKGGYNVSVK